MQNASPATVLTPAEDEAARNLGIVPWAATTDVVRPADKPQKPKTGVDVSVPFALIGIVRWAAADPARRKAIDPALEDVNPRSCQGRLLVAALAAFGFRKLDDDKYEISEDAAHNRFAHQRAVLQAEHAAAQQAQQQ